jgi:hypothetical protein
MAREDYIPVVGDDWYQRRRRDDEGEFFRKVADQGPRKGEHDSTRQGIYCFTADGTLLAYRNGQDPDVMRAVFRRGLAAWRALPEGRRRPGAVRVDGPGTVDAAYNRTPPSGGLIANVSARILDRDEDGTLRKATCEFTGGEKSARDHLWLTEVEVQSLVPDALRVGDSFSMPARVADRLLRFHLVDNTRGEPPAWSKRDIRASDLRLIVEEATPERVKLRLVGSALLATAVNPIKAARGFDVHLLGYLGYDRRRHVMDQFRIVAIGDHWGEGAFTGGARPGRTPLGVAFQLADRQNPADLVPPQMVRDARTYFQLDSD